VQHAPQWAQTAEHGVGLTWRIMTLLSEGRRHLRRVWFPHLPVSPEDAYHARFGARVTFRAERPALAFAVRDLDLPLSEGNRELHDLAAAYLDKQVPRRRAAFTLQVRQAIEALLGTGTCGHRQVANARYMHPRTLQRRLREENTTFEEIKDDVRRDLALRYLAQSEVPLTQVTALLEYSEQSALGRSCRRWYQASPKEVRNRLVAGAPMQSIA
jgi:AraC-like DNA-binding protein